MIDKKSLTQKQWNNYKSITSIISRKLTVTDLGTKAKYLRKKLTAASFLIHDLTTNKTLLKFAENTRREIASLTKIATFYSAYHFLKKNNINIETALFEISAKASWMRGTSAKLVKGFYMTVKDLFYGLMLPSGNDAAMCLAENIGRLIRLSHGSNLNPKILNTKNCSKPDFYWFIDLMNNDRKELGMKNSFFMNPHGLNNPKNFSTCEDLMILCRKALQIEVFKEIIKCKEHKGLSLIHI